MAGIDTTQITEDVVLQFEALLPASNSWWTPAVSQRVSSFLDEHQDLEALLCEALAVEYGDEVSPLLSAKLEAAGIRSWHVCAIGYWELQAKKRNYRAWRYQRRSLRFRGPATLVRISQPRRFVRGSGRGCRSRSSTRARARSPGRQASDDSELAPPRRRPNRAPFAHSQELAWA